MAEIILDLDPRARAVAEKNDATLRIAALKARGDRLRAIARPMTFLGLLLLPLSLIWWMDPSGNDDFTDYVWIPSELVPGLWAAGAGVADVPLALVRVGVAPIMGYAIPALVVGVRLFVWLAARLRRLGWPDWLTVVGPLTIGVVILISLPSAPRHRFDAARVGAIGDGGLTAPVQRDGTGENFVKPYHLDPSRFDRRRADAARYVLAQQAYLDGRPAKVAAQLRAMTGAWLPTTPNERLRLGVLVSYAEAAGLSTGTSGASLAVLERPGFHRAIALGVLGLGVLLTLLGLTSDVIGIRRLRRCATFSQNLATAESFDPATSPARL